MSIGLRVIMILVCAYAGWQTASVQFGDVSEPQHLTQENGARSVQTLTK